MYLYTSFYVSLMSGPQRWIWEVTEPLYWFLFAMWHLWINSLFIIMFN